MTGRTKQAMMGGAFSLEGKTAIVFGVGPAIGNQIAKAFASAGANVIANARTSQGVETLVHDINAVHRDRAAGIAEDIATQQGLEKVLAFAEDTFGDIDIGFFNAYALDAGHKQTFTHSSCLDTTEEDWQACFNVNVLAPFRIAKSLAPKMQKRGGVIINNLAAAAFTPILPALAYGCTKSALATMTKYLAKECAPTVRFNAISPSNIEAPDRPKMLEDAVTAFPMRRMGAVEEVAGAAVFLASPASSYITGQIIYVDGGRVATL